VREKDGLWAVLFWLNILAARRGESVEQIVRAHWARFGRNYYTRHDYEAVPTDAAAGVMVHLRSRLGTLPGSELAGRRVAAGRRLRLHDPIDGSRSTGQGLRLLCEDGSRVVFRLSGTGTEGATLRVYFEAYEPDPMRQAEDAQVALAPLVEAALALAELRERTGRSAPTVIT
jgi:phosphoglucomutase